MSISRRYSNNLAQCEDVFQECFIQIFKSIIESKAEIKDLDSWIARISINTNISAYYQSQKVTHEPFTTDVLDESHRQIIDEVSSQDLLKIIQELPDGYRVIFNMYLIDGYKHDEIAKELGITASTSRSQLARAKELLKNRLEQNGIDRYEST